MSHNSHFPGDKNDTQEQPGKDRQMNLLEAGFLVSIQSRNVSSRTSI